MNETEIRRRIDRRGWGPFFNKLWVASGLGWMADAMNVAALGLVLPLILSDLGLSRAEGGAIASATFLGFMVGAILTGKLADVFGRRTLLIANILLFSAAAVGVGFAQNYWMLVGLRFVQGIGMGGEFPIISTYLNELAPRRYRDRLVGLTSAFFAYAFALVPLIGLFLVPLLGWRGLFWTLVLPVVFAIWARRSLPESPIFLARQGKSREAEEALRVIEAGSVEKEEDVGHTEAATQAPTIRKVASGRTALLLPLWILTFFCQYGFVSWTPTAITQANSNISSGYILTSILFTGMIAGYLAAALGASKLNPRLFLILSFVEFGLSLVLFGLSSNIVFMVIFGWFAAAGYGLTTISAYSYTPGQFETGIRGTGMGLVTGVGRLGAVVGPMVVGWLNPVGGLGTSFIAFGAASLLAVAVIQVLERGSASGPRRLNVERA
jgi:putative MFS transporter